MIKIREKYSEIGVKEFYLKNGDSYINPHEEIIQQHLSYFLNKNLIDTSKILDLCCGSGEVSKFFISQNITNIKGIDPYTFNNYKKQTNLPCFEYNFKDIANGKIKEKFSLIVCSFALHLADKSLLPNILFNLASISEQLIIISPHKKPDINIFWNLEEEYYNQKVRTRLFKKSFN